MTRAHDVYDICSKRNNFTFPTQVASQLIRERKSGTSCLFYASVTNYLQTIVSAAHQQSISSVCWPQYVSAKMAMEGKRLSLAYRDLKHVPVEYVNDYFDRVEILDMSYNCMTYPPSYINSRLCIAREGLG